MAQHEGGGKDERDLILAPNEYAYILDETKGNVQVYVGPHKSSPAGTDQPVIFDSNNKKFMKCSLEASKQKWVTAPEGWYIVLKNPSNEPSRVHPKAGTIENLPDLGVGRKINIRGPVTFPLWPGQMSKVNQGHHLRSNQYLIVRVYDEEAAKENWSSGVVKTREGEEVDLPNLPDLTIGKLLVIKGTDVSFYIPPTGVEVVADGLGYIREAVTLENLEYCILLDEDGNKVFRHGPDVVFPSPTQAFVEKEGSRKFRALELNKISGIYVKVIEAYVEDDGTKREAGQELWITGDEQSIYYPRAEHAVIKYGNQTIHYAVAIPKGEGRYVLNRDTGVIDLVRGPKMLLLDPRTYVIARRALPDKAVQLWFPSNVEALNYNRHLNALVAEDSGRSSDFLTEDSYRNKAFSGSKGILGSPYSLGEVRTSGQWSGTTTVSGSALNMDERSYGGYQVSEPTDHVVGEDFNRKQKFSPPRTITLDSKYDGAVRIDVWTGYAVLVKSATGDRKVVVGPDTILLEYDETLETFELSKGNPKSSDNTVRDVYLRAKNNKLSDTIDVETKDMCGLTLQLKYRVNFEGDPDKWFDVENYVQFLVDHMRSMLKGLVRGLDVKTFYGNPVAVIRNAILGESVDGQRPGRLFEENGMRVYDVEILAVELDDQGIEDSLIQAQQEAIKSAIFISSKEQELERVTKAEAIQRSINSELATTALAKVELELRQAMAAHQQEMAAIGNATKQQEARLTKDHAKQEQLNEINAVELQRLIETESTQLKLKSDRNDIDVAFERAMADVQAAITKVEVAAVRDKLQAMGPGMVEALQVVGDKELAQKMAEAMSWSSMIGGKNPAELLTSLLSGTKIQDAVKGLMGYGQQPSTTSQPRG
jgi:major vault protein